MRVFAYMASPSGLTGEPRRLLNLASALREQGIKMCIATRRNSDLFRVAEEQGLDTLQVEPIGVLRQRHGALLGGNAVFRLKALLSLLVLSLGIARKIRRQGADVVWIRGSKGIAFAGLGAILSRCPLVWDVDYELPSRGVVRWLHRLGLWAAKRVVFQYSSAPDEIFGSDLATRYRYKFRTIIPGIDLRSLQPFLAKRNNNDGRNGDPFIILQVGTICDRKNQRLLIDALSTVRQTHKDDSIRVHLVGGVFEEDYADALKEMIDDGGLVEEFELLGWRSDIHKLMANADVLAMPSRDEGVPNAVQEAMAIGLPVMVSEAGGMPEVVIEGKTGWILRVDSPRGWADRIVWCLENRKELNEVGQHAAAYAMENFGTSQWDAEYARLLHESCVCSK